eukprot:NODE_18769_length_877_cov_6.709333.p2 GENE.NODE_18769_length_877_cov_6.709333~~NODE_18769_length_877_cov_6.709333.p2  ORF type:complete len:171 (-),score=52.40 NODE_18769_length_877_cov_6.709333:266-778(-)
MFALRAAVRPMATRAAVPARRTFASANPVAAVAALHEDVIKKSVALYKSNQSAIVASLEAELAGNNLVVFMDGTPDAPKSELSLNLVKMLTQCQAVPFVSIDVLTHPALLGFTVTKSGSTRTPHVYLAGSYYGDHDNMLQMYKSGNLQEVVGTHNKTSGTFAGELPIATY